MKIAILLLAIILVSIFLITSQKQLSEQERFYYDILGKASKAGFSLNCNECSEMILTDVKDNPYIFYKKMKHGDSSIFFEFRANPDAESAAGIIDERIDVSRNKEGFAILSDKFFVYKENGEHILQWADKNYNFVLRGEKNIAEKFLMAMGVLSEL